MNTPATLFDIDPIPPRDPRVPAASAPRIVRPIAPVRRCTFPACDRVEFAKGLCSCHYQRKLRGKPLLPLPPLTVKHCTFPGCDKPLRGKGLCNAHYLQIARGQPLRPLGFLPPSPVVKFHDRAEVVLFNRQGGEAGRAIIDLRDVPLVSAHRWSKSTGGYATRHATATRNVGMHNDICPSDHDVDHKDGDRLNNRRSNLRPATPGQNCQNVVRPGREEDRNIYFDKRSKYRPWVVMAQLNRKRVFGGSYVMKEDARAAARALRAKLFTHHNEARHV